MTLQYDDARSIELLTVAKGLYRLSEFLIPPAYPTEP